MMLNERLVGLLLIGVSAIAISGGARAQSLPDLSANSPAGGLQAPQEGVADIIVTATKVETSLQKTPQTITAVSGETLARQGVSTAQELNKLVGGLQVEQNGSGASIFIRGVGSRSLAPTSDPAVAFSVDGIYYSRATGTSATLFDISRIEVVKGPQGTLYGRNATGGAVNVITNRPILGERHLDGEIEIGNYQAIRGIAAVNLPLGDSAALRIAAQNVYRKGYLSDGSNDDNTKSARASLLFNPGKNLSIYLSADYAHQGGQGATTVPVGPGSNNNALTTRFVVPNDPFAGPSDPRMNAFLHAAAPASALAVPLPGLYCVGVPFTAGGPPAANPVGSPAILTCGNPIGVADNVNDDFVNNDFYGANATVDADLGFARLTAIGGYRGSKIDSKFRVDPGPQRVNTKISQYTGELRLASEPGTNRLKWLIGGFYLREQQANDTIISSNNSAVSNPIPAPGSPLPRSSCVAPLDPDGPGPLPPTPGLCLANVSVVQQSFRIFDPAILDESYAAFGQATFSLTEGLRITGGVRYTHERKAEKNGVVTSNYTLPAGVSVSYLSQGAAKFNDVSYRAGLEADLTKQSLLYGHYSTAFHAGGFNLGVPQGPNPYTYEPEKVKSYIIGIKNRFFDNRLQINVEGFWLDYNNYQINQLGRVNDGSAPCSTLAIIQACPFTLRTNNAATARVRGVEADIVFAPVRNTTLSVNIIYNDAKFIKFVQLNPFTGAPTDYSGFRLPGANPFVVTGGIRQALPLASGGQIVADVRSQYKMGAYSFYVHVPGNYQNAYTRTDISLTYEAPERRYSVTAFVRNIENKATLLQGGPIDVTTGAVYTNLNPPRTYGVNIGFHY